jgi:threonylcarbamoyladenosine tRNA methylthiotransferase MtaB
LHETSRVKSPRKRVAVFSLGCKLNQAEGEAMKHLCGESGCDLVPFGDEADVYVVNTCTVTSEADREGRRLARQARRRAPEGARVIIAGCSAQANTRGMLIPEADLLLGNAEKLRLPDYLGGAEGAVQTNSVPGPGSAPEVCVAPIAERSLMDTLALPNFEGRARAFLKVQDGCDFSCTFCATTLARGKSRSLAPDECAAQAALLAGSGSGRGGPDRDALDQSGHREIVLTGIHLGAYGRDLKPRATLSRLVGRVLEAISTGDAIGTGGGADAGGAMRLRLSSVEPGEVTRELVRICARSAFGKKASSGKREPYVCRHFHIPVQSGDDEILGAMARNYTADRCARRFEEIARAIPGVCLGADFIAGFPGESESAFERTMAWVREAPVSYLHVFPYSPREGTGAAALPGRLHGSEMRRRARALGELGRRKWAAFLASQAGAEAEVLFERRTEDGRLTGLTDNYIRVAAEGPDEWIREIVPMRLAADAGAPAPGGAIRAQLAGVPVA